MKTLILQSDETIDLVGAAVRFGFNPIESVFTWALEQGLDKDPDAIEKIDARITAGIEKCAKEFRPNEGQTFDEFFRQCLPGFPLSVVQKNLKYSEKLYAARVKAEAKRAQAAQAKATRYARYSSGLTHVQMCESAGITQAQLSDAIVNGRPDHVCERIMSVSALSIERITAYAKKRVLEAPGLDPYIAVGPQSLWSTDVAYIMAATRYRLFSQEDLDYDLDHESRQDKVTRMAEKRERDKVRLIAMMKTANISVEELAIATLSAYDSMFDKKVYSAKRRIYNMRAGKVNIPQSLFIKLGVLIAKNDRLSVDNGNTMS